MERGYDENDQVESHRRECTRIVIRQISAGSDEPGSTSRSSHSAAIDSRGNLYTWGTFTVCGHKLEPGVRAPEFQSLPRLVTTLEVRSL